MPTLHVEDCLCMFFAACTRRPLQLAFALEIRRTKSPESKIERKRNQGLLARLGHVIRDVIDRLRDRCLQVVVLLLGAQRASCLMTGPMSGALRPLPAPLQAFRRGAL